MAEEQVYYATGRRKTSSARVFLKPGSGKIQINDKEASTYLSAQTNVMLINQPYTVTNTKGNYDAFVTVKGGGQSGQAGAIRHGIARALLLIDDAHRGSLKTAGYLTRDSRKVERKKCGLKKSRKSSQFSKR